MADAEILGQVVLPNRSIRQPAAHVVAGGDCGPCALGGMLWSAEGPVPEPTLSVRNREAVVRAYGLTDQEHGRQALSWPGMRQALHNARNQGLVDRLLDDVPSWPREFGGIAIWGSPGWNQNLEWFGRVRMGIDGGYYGFCSVSMSGAGPLCESDHWVLVCGAREVRRRHATVKDCWSIDQEILVSCSAQSPEGRWLEVREFLRRRGGFNVILARPSRKI